MAVSKGRVFAGIVIFLLLYAIGTLIWLAYQPPVLRRSQEKDPLSGYPLRVSLNPIRDRAPERAAEKVIRAVHDGRCREEFDSWLKDYRRQYTEFTCKSELAHPLLSWQLFDREDSPPLVILHYHVHRNDTPAGQFQDLWITTQLKDTGWAVTKFGAMY
jgi:hypothetical protein